MVITLPSGKLIESQVRSGSEGKKSYLVIFSDDGRRGSNVNQAPPHGKPSVTARDRGHDRQTSVKFFVHKWNANPFSNVDKLKHKAIIKCRGLMINLTEDCRKLLQCVW